MKVSTLLQLCGSDCGRLSDYRGKLRLALDELVTAGVIAGWNIDQEDKVHVHKADLNTPIPSYKEGA